MLSRTSVHLVHPHVFLFGTIFVRFRLLLFVNLSLPSRPLDLLRPIASLTPSLLRPQTPNPHPLLHGRHRHRTHTNDHAPICPPCPAAWDRRRGVGEGEYAWAREREGVWGGRWEGEGRGGWRGGGRGVLWVCCLLGGDDVLGKDGLGDGARGRAFLSSHLVLVVGFGWFLDSSPVLVYPLFVTAANLGIVLFLSFFPPYPGPAEEALIISHSTSHFTKSCVISPRAF